MTRAKRHVGLLLAAALVVLCLGCGQQSGSTLTEEELHNEEDAVAEKPQPKQMAHSHKSGPEHEGKPLDYWVAESESDSIEARRAAADALGNLGPAAVAALTELLRDKDLGVRLAAAKALKNIKGQKK